MRSRQTIATGGISNGRISNGQLSNGRPAATGAVAGVAATCAARSDARVRAICVAGALKIYWEQVPKIYTNLGSILFAEPLENVFSKNNFSKNQKLGIFFFSGGDRNCLGSV
jgi:hypothetical protein